MTTTLSAAKGPLAVTSRSTMLNPNTSAIAMATKSVSRPLATESIPPRLRRMRGGGGGAAIGLIASLGDRGAMRGC